MKNKKSPLKFAGLIGSAAATSHLRNRMNRIGGIFGGNRGNTNFTGVGGLGEQYAGVGARPASIVDAGSQFDPATMNVMQGIFGDVSGRQASLGSSGIYALKEHLSPVKNEDDGVWGPGEAEAAFDKMKYITDANIKKGAGAYIEVNKNEAGADSYEDPDYYDNLSSEELERKFPKSGKKINK